MSYSVKYDKDTDIVLVVIEGDFDLTLLKSMAAEVAHCLKDNDCKRVLSDMRSAKLLNCVTDIYRMPECASAAGISRAIKRALVVNTITDNYHFLETVFINMANEVMLFTDVDKAMEWLRGKVSAP